MSDRSIAYLITGVVATVNKVQQFTNFAQRESQFSRLPDKEQSLYVLMTVDAMSAGATRRIWHQANFRVVANGLDIDPRF